MAVRFTVSAKTSQESFYLIEELKIDFNFNNGVPFSRPPDAPLNEIEEVSLRDVERMAVSYVLGLWFTPHKEYFVVAWVDRHFNFGYTSTSRIEGNYRLLKVRIGGSTCSLYRLAYAER